MKGTHCGKRAVTLVFSLISLALAVPALANADVLQGTSVPSTAPVAPPPVSATPASVPNFPALPPAPLAPVNAPALAQVPIVSATSSGLTVQLPKSWVKRAKATAAAVKAVKATKQPLHLATGLDTSASAAATQATANVSTTTHKAKKLVSIMLKKPTRFLAWNDDDPQSGCKRGEFLICTPPMSSQMTVTVNNRCTDPANPGSSSGTFVLDPAHPFPGAGTLPPAGDETAVFPNGTVTTWVSPPFIVWKNGVPHTLVRIRVFMVGVSGFGVQSAGITDPMHPELAPMTGTTYKFGRDQQDTIVFDVTAGTDTRTYDQLIVNNGLAPSMWFYQHTSFNAAAARLAISYHVVCQNHQRAHDDDDRCGGHDHSGDMDKYKHSKQDFHGYNNDDDDHNWDQQD